LIDDVLDLSRIEAGRVLVSLETVALSAVLAEVKATLDPMATRAEMDVVIQPLPVAAPEVVADRTRFAQILINYGSNALKYGKPGGKAVFSVALSEPGLVRVSVADDGIGIPLEQQDRIFQPFHRAGQEAGPIQGTGIGLAITKQLAELMDGRVGFTSSPGAGSTFWIDLPVHVAAEESLAKTADLPTPALSSLAAGERRTIVYIEDNPSNITFMHELIGEFENVDLLTVPTAEVGIELVRARNPDVVLMDINLPGMSGYEATRKLAEWPETKHIPVIALTAAAMTSDRKRLADAGFYRYLTKPVRVAELIETLEELFARAAEVSRV
jgi:CheY-like chemotaxis protein/two-component sensor histidine kinase